MHICNSCREMCVLKRNEVQKLNTPVTATKNNGCSKTLNLTPLVSCGILCLIKESRSENCNAIRPPIRYDQNPGEEPTPLVRRRLRPGSCIVTDCFITTFQIRCRSKQIHLLSRPRKQDVLPAVPQRHSLMFYRPSTAVSHAVQLDHNLCKTSPLYLFLFLFSSLVLGLWCGQTSS